jgi:hypothetical protein
MAFERHDPDVHAAHDGHVPDAVLVDGEAAAEWEAGGRTRRRGQRSARGESPWRRMRSGPSYRCAHAGVRERELLGRVRGADDECTVVTTPCGFEGTVLPSYDPATRAGLVSDVAAFRTATPCTSASASSGRDGKGHSLRTWCCVRNPRSHACTRCARAGPSTRAARAPRSDRCARYRGHGRRQRLGHEELHSHDELEPRHWWLAVEAPRVDAALMGRPGPRRAETLSVRTVPVRHVCDKDRPAPSREGHG